MSRLFISLYLDEDVDVALTRAEVIGLEMAIPPIKPTTAPSTVNVVDSAMNWVITERLGAPMAFKTPTSRRRSRTIINIESNKMSAAPMTAPMRV